MLFYPQSNRLDDALAVLEQLLKRDPDHRPALLNKGAILIRQKKHALAVAALDRLLESDPKNTLGLLNRAIANFQLEKYDEAKRDYQTLLSLSANNPHPIYHGLGEIAHRSGDKREALRNYKLYLETAPAGTDEYNAVLARVKEFETGKSP